MNRAMISSVPRATPRPSLSFGIWLNDAVKRLVDACGALAGLIVLSPFFAIIAIYIRRHSPGPIFYRATRVGMQGRPFGMLKFCTMEQWHDARRLATVTAQDDPRVTPLGRRLRTSKINELPQLWNVLKGEMSLVGPRPEDPAIVAKWPESARREVLSVRPGVTSPASVLYRNEETLLSNGNVMKTYLQSVLPTKLRLDQLYVRNRSIWLDLDVLGWTVLVLLPKLRSVAPKEELLFLGPVARVGRRFVNWFIVDAIISLMAVSLAGLLWRHFLPLDIGWPAALATALAFAALFSLMGALLGLHRIAWSHALATDAFGLAVSATIAGSTALTISNLRGPAPLLPPGMIVLASVLAFAGFVAARYRSRLLKGLGANWVARTGGALSARERVLIIGSGQTGQFVAWLLGNGSSVGMFHIVGYVDDDIYKQGMRYHGISVVGRRSDVCRLVEQHDVGIIIFAIHNIEPMDRKRVLALCGNTTARVVEVPDIVGTLNAVVAREVKEGRHNPNAASQRTVSTAESVVAQDVPAAQAQVWLSGLEQAAKQGDLAAVGDQISRMREELAGLGT